MSKRAMKQHCYMFMIYSSWVIYAGGLGWLLWRHRYGLAAAWIVGVPLVQWLYIRIFPRISGAMGYGDVSDRAPSEVATAPAEVRFYAAVGCPFCPIVEERLEQLQREMGFTLVKQDVTLRPDVLAAHGIRSVPVVEVGQRRLVGNATSRELAEAILAPQESLVAVGGAR